MPTIYVDVIWLENFCLDLWILFVAALLGKCKVSFKRLLLGATVAAFFSLSVFIPVAGDLLSAWGGKAVMSVLLTVVTFPWRGWRSAIKQLALFYVASFLTGGVVLGIGFFGESSLGNLQIVNDRFTWRMNLGLAVLFGSLPLVFYLVDQLMRAKRQHIKMQERLSVQIRMGQFQTEVQAIVDTGNSLQDPFNHEPVSVTVAASILSVLPASFRMLYEGAQDPVLQLGKTSIESEFESRIRIIPYRGVGGSSGMLLAFTPDEWWVTQGDQKIPLQGLIALQTGALCNSDSYQMILHPDALLNNSHVPPVAELKGASLA